MSDRKSPRVRPPRTGGRMDRSPGPTSVAAERLVVTTAIGESDYCSVGYRLTSYGYVPTETWDKYVAATERDDR